MAENEPVRKEVDVRDLMENGVRDGEAEVGIDEADGAIAMRVKGPFTIWYPERVEGAFALSFDCLVKEGFVGFRCMSPGKAFKVRNIAIEAQW